MSSVEERREYDRNYYARMSPEAKRRKQDTQGARRYLLRVVVSEYKHGKSCACGEAHPACLDFHHEGDDKEINVSDAVRYGWSVKRLMAEIAKCILICSNCHRKLHAG